MSARPAAGGRRLLSPVNRPMHSPEDDFNEGLRLHQGGQLAQAEELYRRILDRDPTHAGALHLLGVLAQQRGDHEQAVELIGQAIALVPDRAVYRNNHGVALRALGRTDEAIASFLEALRIRPDYVDAISNLGIARHDRGELELARAQFEEALQRDPQHSDAHYNLANLLRELGRDEQAITHYQIAHRLAPARADVLNNLGITLLVRGETDAAIEQLQHAVTLDPGGLDANLNLGSALAQAGRTDDAVACYKAAARTCPNDLLWPVRIASACPIVFPDRDAIDRYRAGLEATLDAHRGAGLAWDAQNTAVIGCVPPFNLAHHGRDERRMREKFAALYREPAQRPEPEPHDGPPRIGFLVTHRNEGAFLRCMSGIIEQLDPARFEPIVFGAAGGIPRLKQGIDRPGLRFVPFSGQLKAIADRVRSVRCDLLLHWEVGLDSLNYRLPFARLAPVQCTTWGIQATTGLAAVDYYVSSDLVEAAGAEDHYTETLVRLPALLSYSRRTPRPDPPATRSEFGLPDNVTLYACLQRPLKLHPDFDALLAGILRRDPNGRVVLLKGLGTHLSSLLAERFARTMPDVADRILLLPWQEPAQYRRLLSVADVVLDPLPYGSGSSCYDIFSYDLPLVTLPGIYNAGRYALGCYRRMGLMDLVARSPEEYVDIASRLGLTRDYREHIASRIAAVTPLLFEDKTVVRAFEDCFDRALVR